jgi:transposase-like protein
VIDAVKADARAIYRADGRAQAQAAARAFCQRWRTAYPCLVRQLEADLPELLSFFRLPATYGRAAHHQHH